LREKWVNKKEKGILFGYYQDYVSFPEQSKILKDNEKNISSKIANNIRFIPATKDKLRIGLVGAGQFAHNILVPILAKTNDISLTAIVDVDSNQATKLSRFYKEAIICSDDDDLFQKDLVDIVMIASPHKYHTNQICKALEQGKAVFVEKPMAVNFKQLDQLRSLLNQTPALPFCVDYNRSFSPFMKKIKKTIKQRRAPLMMQYRINAGRIPQAHWIQTDIGAGRVIGEACQIIDLFCFLTDAQPIAVSVESLHASRDDIFPTDNFCTQIRFDDGSLCSLFYSALGHVKVSKEYMEIFFDSKAIVMSDYKNLHGFGIPSWFNEVASTADEGHEALVNEFFSALKQDIFIPPINFDRLNIVAYLTLIIDQLVCEGGGTKEL
jgi:predicted dehydrogenase